MHASALLATLIVALPAAAFAAGSDATEPPKPTQTTTTCTKAQVWDDKQKKCVDAQSGSLTDDDRFRAVRELAWADRPEEALVVLSAMTEGETDRVLTYKGFAHRKAGRLDLGMQHYAHALEVNPDNVLARSYLGQMLVEMGEIAAARRQLDEIRARGGAGTWAEASLARAVGTGQTLSY
jgi:Flp pilus assembly protein TadD